MATSPRTAPKNSPKKSAPQAKSAKAAKPRAQSGDIFDLIGKTENIEQAAMAMQAMAHPLRIKILCLLSSGEIAVGEIVEAVGTTQGNVSQHLGILKASGMITSRNEGKKTFYRIDDKRVIKIVAMTRDAFCSN
ncbi:MAG: ArsR/SmtB family transcription factor [Burkholderiales bacterium]